MINLYEFKKLIEKIHELLGSFRTEYITITKGVASLNLDKVHQSIIHGTKGDNDKTAIKYLNDLYNLLSLHDFKCEEGCVNLYKAPKRTDFADLPEEDRGRDVPVIVDNISDVYKSVETFKYYEKNNPGKATISNDFYIISLKRWYTHQELLDKFK